MSSRPSYSAEEYFKLHLAPAHVQTNPQLQIIVWLQLYQIVGFQSLCFLFKQSNRNPNSNLIAIQIAIQQQSHIIYIYIYMYIRTHCVSAILAQGHLSKNVCNPAGPKSCTTKTKLFTQTLLGLNNCMQFITIYLYIGIANNLKLSFRFFCKFNIYIYIYITHLFHILDAKILKKQSPLDTRALGCLVIILKWY